MNSVGPRGMWRVDEHQLSAYLERFMEQTSARAKKHPSTPPTGPAR